MLPQIIWWVGLVLGFSLLARSLWNHTLPTYSHFYAYIACVFVTQPLLYFIYVAHPAAYKTWFWRQEMLTLFFGCGIILEIFRHVLAAYPGAERFARIAGLCVFGAIFAVALIYPEVSSGLRFAGSMEWLERDLRAVQAILLFGLLLVISYYRIPLGQNIRGMIAGYGLFIGTALVNMTLRAYGTTGIALTWAAIQPISFDVSLLIWLSALWVYRPNPLPSVSAQLENDYETLALRTRGLIAGMRSQFARAARP